MLDKVVVERGDRCQHRSEDHQSAFTAGQAGVAGPAFGFLPGPVHEVVDAHPVADVDSLFDFVGIGFAVGGIQQALQRVSQFLILIGCAGGRRSLARQLIDSALGDGEVRAG